MSALVQALDAFTPTQVGENDHIEYAWANDIKEKIVQFDFQCTRTNTGVLVNLSTILDNLLQTLSVKNCNNPTHEAERKDLLIILYKMIGKTRDIEGGKGEYSIAYMMIWTWFKHFPDLAAIALALFVFPPKRLLDVVSPDVYGSAPVSDQIPYGSWKDIKYFCQYIRDQGAPETHPLIHQCVCFINSQLSADRELYYSTVVDNLTISLVSKWIPREKSKFGWMYSQLACGFYPEYMNSVKPNDTVTRTKAINKCKTEYRTLCSRLNRHLDTVQIKQCAKSWSTIDHAKTTSITMAKQRKAFLNTKSNKSQRSQDPDRIACADNLRVYFESLKKEGKEIKGKNVALPDFTKQAQALMQWEHRGDNPGYIIPKSEEADILNSQWRDNGNKKNANGLGPMVAMCDLSGSMDGDPLAAAVALSCRIAEKSCLGRRVMTFAKQPAWINLDDKVDFTDMTAEILSKSRTAGLNTDFYKALDLMLNAIEQHRVPPIDVENMVLAIFSDMQIDDCLCYKTGSNNYDHTEQQTKQAYSQWSVMHENIRQKYAEVGMRMYGEPLKAPHILFWNLRSTSGFPTMSSEAGCSMMSGFDPTILNMFCELGMDALKDLTPYNGLLKTLTNDRYIPLELAFRTIIN